MSKLIKTLCIGALGVTMAAGLAACGSDKDKNYTVTFVDGAGVQIGETYTVTKNDALTAPDYSSYLGEKHFVGYKLETSDGVWGDLLTALPASVSADTKILIVLEDHAYNTTEHDENGHWTKCDCGETTESQNHTMTEVKEEYVAPDCETDGKKVEACECGYKHETPEEKLGHQLGNWKSDDDNHWKACERTGCDLTETEKAAHDLEWRLSEDGNVFEHACKTCDHAVESLAKTAFTSANLKTDWAVTEGESGAVSLENDKVTVNLSTATGISDTSLLLNKKYEEFLLKYTLMYTTPTHTGERYASVRIGDYTIRYYPYADQMQVLYGMDLIASCYEGALSQHATVEVEAKVAEGCLYVYVDGKLLSTNEKEYTANGLTGAQTIGIYANRVGFEMTDIALYHGEGADRIERFVYDSAKLQDSDVIVPEYSGNAVSLENDKVQFTLSNDTSPESEDYDAQVILNTYHKGSFEITFDLTHETGHTQTRFLAISIGGVTFMIKPSEEKVFAYRGEYNEPTNWRYSTVQNAVYMNGKITIRLENGSIYFYHNDVRLSFDNNADFYFSDIDSSAGLNLTFTARRLNLQIENLTVTSI